MSTSSSPPDRSVDHLRELSEQVAAGLLDRTLAKVEWTHEAHLLACIAIVRSHGRSDALDVLRRAIPAYNEATGVANTPTGGYHDTITVYFVWAIDRLLVDGSDTAEILGHPSVARTALSAWWETSTLMSSAARAGWVAPDRAGDGGARPTEWLQPDLTSA